MNRIPPLAILLALALTGAWAIPQARAADDRTKIEKQIDELEAKNPAQYGADADGNYEMRDCPVVGNLDANTASGKKEYIYHMPGQRSYKAMLKINKGVVEGKAKDNRICFESEADVLAFNKLSASKRKHPYKSGETLKFRKATN